MSARGRLILIVASFAFVLPALPAHAKGIAKATVCGADGCTNVTSAARGPAGCRSCSAEQLLGALPGSAHPTRRAPWVRIVLSFRHPGGDTVEGRERILWAPELQLSARSDGPGRWAWFQPTAEALAVADRLAREVRPYPASTMPLGAPPPVATASTDPAGASPAGASGETGGGLPLLTAGAILAAAFAAGVVALAIHRRRHPGPRTSAAAG